MPNRIIKEQNYFNILNIKYKIKKVYLEIFQDIVEFAKHIKLILISNLIKNFINI